MSRCKCNIFKDKNMNKSIHYFVDNFFGKPLIFSKNCVTHTHTHTPPNTHPPSRFLAQKYSFFVTSYKLRVTSYDYPIESFFSTQITQIKQIFTDLYKLPRFCFAKSPLQKFEGDYSLIPHFAGRCAQRPYRVLATARIAPTYSLHSNH